MHNQHIEERTPGRDSSIMQVSCRADTGATIGLCEQQRELAARSVRVDNLALIKCPVILGSVTTVIRCVHHDARKVGEGVLLHGSVGNLSNKKDVANLSVLADGLRHASIQRVGVKRVAAT